MIRRSLSEPNYITLAESVVSILSDSDELSAKYNNTGSILASGAHLDPEERQKVKVRGKVRGQLKHDYIVR